MPTRDRRRFVPQALRYFERQDYEPRELIVVDDGADSIADLMPADARDSSVRPERPQSVGQKRNIACELSQGEYIVHWDDDEWIAPERVSRQVGVLRSGQAD